MALRKVPMEKPYQLYRYRFCGLPMGVSILPRLAAAVSSTSSRMVIRSASCRGIPSNSSNVKGTRVTRVTSLVNSMLRKKHSSTNSKPTMRTLCTRRNSPWHRAVNAPVCRMPATVSMRHSSRINTRKSM